MAFFLSTVMSKRECKEQEIARGQQITLSVLVSDMNTELRGIFKDEAAI